MDYETHHFNAALCGETRRNDSAYIPICTYICQGGRDTCVPQLTAHSTDPRTTQGASQGTAGTQKPPAGLGRHFLEQGWPGPSAGGCSGVSTSACGFLGLEPAGGQPPLGAPCSPTLALSAQCHFRSATSEATLQKVSQSLEWAPPLLVSNIKFQLWEQDARSSRGPCLGPPRRQRSTRPLCCRAFVSAAAPCWADQRHK